MNETRIRNAILVELVIPRPLGEDAVNLKVALGKRLGEIPFSEFQECLEKMTAEGLLKMDERKVQGMRAATICTATRKGIMSLAENQDGLSKGRESHEESIYR